MLERIELIAAPSAIPRYLAECIVPLRDYPRQFARGLLATATNKIRSGGLLPLPAPAEQTQRTETGGEERQGCRKWRSIC